MVGYPFIDDLIREVNDALRSDNVQITAFCFSALGNKFVDRS